MNLAFPIATPEVHGAILGAKGSPADVFSLLRDAGYNAIEPFVADPAKFDNEAWADAVAKSGLLVVAVGTGPLVFEDRLGFTHPEESVRRASLTQTLRVLRFAARLGAQLNIGKLRGEIEAGQAERQWDWMRAAFTEICDAAAALNVVVTLEPQCRAVINNLNTTTDALDFIKQVGRPNLHLMLDTFHLDAEGEDTAATIALVAGQGQLWHVHFADTGRRAPGEGDIDFRAAITALRAANYTRAITVEIQPYPDWLAAARRAVTYLQPLLASK
jgi:sugar phosphate isomerase/epimerase